MTLLQKILAADTEDLAIGAILIGGVSLFITWLLSVLVKKRSYLFSPQERNWLCLS